MRMLTCPRSWSGIPMPDWEERRETADAIRAHPQAKLVDFTRDGYGTMYVTVDSQEVLEEVIELGTTAGYEVTGRGADRVVLEAPDGAPEKVRMGGNRLSYRPSDRTHASLLGPKKSASRQGKHETDGDEWDPQPAELRDGETPDEDSHARRNAEMLRRAHEELESAEDEGAASDE